MSEIIVEDGSHPVGANSYGSVADFQQYAADRGVTLTGDPSELLIQAMDYLESLSYKGSKTIYNQYLQWPRRWVQIDPAGYSWYGRGYCWNWFPSDQIPQQLKNSLFAIAISIDQGVGPLATIDRATESEQVGPLKVTYSSGSSDVPIVRTINAQLYRLLLGGGNGGNQFAVTRG